jgi:hypothetical protein
MYGFINEVTRQPGGNTMSFTKVRGDVGKHGAPRPVAKARRQARPLPGTYRVLADSFRRAAGFL